jgi:cytochrome c2
MPRRTVIIVGFSLILCFAVGAIFGQFLHEAMRDHIGVSLRTLVKAPLSYWRVNEKGWDSLQAFYYTKDEHSLSLHKNVETNLLPLKIAGERLSESYAVPKMGGAIALVGKTIIVLDRLGGIYSYGLPNGPFVPLKTIPPLPNNLKDYLAHRPGPPINLADATNDQFRARDIIYLPDRRMLAACYDKFDEASGKLRTVVSVIPFDSATFSASGSWREVFATEAFPYDLGITSGAGMLAYRPNGTLRVAIGDHYITEPKVSEDDTSTFGKIIEIDLAKEQWRIISKGHRNPEGLTFTHSGELISAEHGPSGGDELNLVTDGSDFGWPNVTLGTDYNSYDWPPGTSPVGTLASYSVPLFAWLPSIAPTQVIEVNHFDSRWAGDLLVATLKAESIYRIRLNAGRVLYVERIWIGERIRDIVEADDGTLILWTDDTKLLFMTVDKDQLAVGRRTPPVVGSGIVSVHCLACHHFGPTSPTDFAPSLSNLFNRPIASDNFSYSSALHAKQKLGPWTPALLAEFLADPYKFASGTTMSPRAISPEEINDIVANLSAASQSPPNSRVSQ